MKRQTKLTSQEQEQLAEVKSQATAAREFNSAEELLRHDAEHVAVPPEIARRLQESIAKLPSPKPAWWKRFIGGTNP